MADSEARSLEQQERNSELENSAVDIEESHMTNFISTSDDFIQNSPRGAEEKPYGEKTNAKQKNDTERNDCACSSSVADQSNQTCDNIDEVSQYEIEVLNDIFYESDGNDSEAKNSFVQSYSSTTESAQQKVGAFGHKDEKDVVDSENTRPEISHSNDYSPINNISSVNNYCFIDASSLNDETEVSSISLSSANLPSYLDSTDARKSIPLKNGHENIAEFQRELKLIETLEPPIEQRKVTPVDSISEEQLGIKVVEKEALVVEIKEADSGESDHPSPSIDNNKRVQCDYKENIANDIHSDDSEKSTLIRGTTFQLEPGDAKLSHLRQERERRQGNLVFENSIPQYSGHRIEENSFSNTFSPILYFPTKKSHSLDSSSEKLRFSTSRDKNLFSSFNSDTPIDDSHSGLYMMTKSTSDKLFDEFSEIDDSSVAECMSLPISFNGHIVGESRAGTMKRLKRDEMTPIVSGGVSSADYLKSKEKKIESTPIASGSSGLMTVPEEKIKSAKMSSSMTAWVVDMSDCGKSNKKSNPISPNMSQSFSSSDYGTKTPDKQSSLGFFVNLKDIDSPKAPRSSAQSLKKGETLKQSFFIDISTDSDQIKIDKNVKQTPNGTNKSPRDKTERKNIFPMFIDLRDSESSKSLTLPSSSSQSQARTSDDSEEGSALLGDTKSKEKKGVFMFIESDSPVVRRRTLSSSRASYLRHSWNMDKIQNNSNGNGDENSPGKSQFHREHKRAHSVSIDPHTQLKFLTKKSDSNSSLCQSGNMNIPDNSEDQPNSSTNRASFDFGMRETPPNSHVEIINDISGQEYKEHIRSDMCSSTEASGDAKNQDDDRSDASFWEKTGTESTSGHTRKSETFDISNSGSDPSPGSENREFEIEDYRSDRIHDLERDSSSSTKISETHKSLTETIKQIEYELEDDFEIEVSMKKKNDIKHSHEAKPLCSGFVRLSDLDKTPAKKDVIVMEKNPRISSVSYRMSKSIPETSWVESKLALHRLTGPCQVKTLPAKKFSTIMSTSLPAKHESSIIDEFENNFVSEGIPSESDLSSMQSSMGRSGADVSTEETETSSFAVTKPFNRLGEDLLRMFLEEINPDVTLDIGGRRIRAHKCILSSRCQYFAAILSGGWIESAGNVISLQGYSYNSVHFALCHIYSGESNIPDSISIVELATLADMLCLEGLKEIIGYTLKVKYCHLFHKPCQICSVGVLECMPLAAAYGLDEVYRKSLRWITKHFVRIWPSKDFAALPRELMDKCYQQHIVHMSADNVLQTIMDCNKLLATLPNVRWAEPVFRTVSNLLETALKFLANNFSSVLSNEHFQSFGKDLTWNISRVEDNVLSAADRLPPDQACKSYSKIHKLLASIPPVDSSTKIPWSPLFIDFLRKIQARVEKCLVKEATRASRTTNWFTMDLELRRKIQELACLVILPHESVKRPTRHSNFLKETKTPTSQSTINRNLGLRRVKMAISDQTAKVPRNPVVPTKNLMTKPKTDPLERKMQTVKTGPSSESNLRPKSWPNKLEVKSRYLEPRNKPIRTENAPNSLPERVVAQQRRKIMISSSDSSRTSSPAMKRAAENKPTNRLKFSAKRDVKALSNDSLTDTSGARATRKEITSKSCGITRPESPSTKPKDTDIGISADSLVESKKKSIVMKKTGKMDTSMSTDSLMAEISVRPKTIISNRKSPVLGKANVKNMTLAKKSSPPVNQKSPLTVTRRPLREGRSLESSTAASRSRAAATTIHHDPPNLRRNLVDTAKTADIPNKITNGVTSKINSRQTTPSRSTPPTIKKERKESNPSSSESPSKRSPKTNGNSRPSRSITMGKKTIRGIEEKLKGKCNVPQVLKQPTVGARSETFLKEEPTILGKLDMKTTQVI